MWYFFRVKYGKNVNISLRNNNTRCCSVESWLSGGNVKSGLSCCHVIFLFLFFLPSAEYFKSSMKRLPMFQITSTSLNILGSIHRKGAGNSHMRTEWILLKDALLHNTNTQTWINPRGATAAGHGENVESEQQRV